MLFLPFYSMRYEEAVRKNDTQKLEQMLAEIDEILTGLEIHRAQAEEKAIYYTIDELFRKINRRISERNSECQERMDKVMGGHVLELESLKIIHQQRDEGRAEGISVGDARRLLSSVNGVMEKLGISLEEACDIINVTLEQYEAAKELIEVQE